MKLKLPLYFSKKHKFINENRTWQKGLIQLNCKGYLRINSLNLWDVEGVICDVLLTNEFIEKFIIKYDY